MVIHHFKNFLVKRHGVECRRVPIDLGLSCPNRLLSGGGGCAFCTESGSPPPLPPAMLDIACQVARGVAQARRGRVKEIGLIAYFQSGTNTHAPVDRLRTLYMEALSQAKFDMVSIATRPDCLGPEVLSLLAELVGHYDVWVELGVQSASDETLRRVGRGHGFQEVRKAAVELASIGIKVAAHVILGLPGEDFRDFRGTASELSSLPFSAVKIHNLILAKGSRLANMTCGGMPLPSCMDEIEYATALIDFLRRIPAGWPVMRLCAEFPSEETTGTVWSLDKAQFIQFVESAMSSMGVSQGDLVGTKLDGQPPVSAAAALEFKSKNDMKNYRHPGNGAPYNSSTIEWVSVASEAVWRRFAVHGKPVRILDVGFGLGHGTLAAMEAIHQKGGLVEIVALEKELLSLTIATEAHKQETMGRELISSLKSMRQWEGKHGTVELILGDARTTLQSLTGSFDLILLDPPPMDRFPELWTFDFMRLLYAKLSDGVAVAIPVNKPPAIGAMMRTGLRIGSLPNGGRIGFKMAEPDTPIPEFEMAVARRSSSGAVYRDASLSDSPVRILERRARLLSRLRRLGAPKRVRPGKTQVI